MGRKVPSHDGPLRAPGCCPALLAPSHPTLRGVKADGQQGLAWSVLWWERAGSKFEGVSALALCMRHDDTMANPQAHGPNLGALWVEGVL